MRNFSMRFYKNLIWIYLCVLICFSYSVFLGEIPDHIYISEGESVECHFSVPVTVTEKLNEKTVANLAGSKMTPTNQYTIVCKLFGIFPMKEVEVSVVQAQKIYASGRLIGIYGTTEGVLVLDTSPIEGRDGLNYEPAENKVISGDYIFAVNNVEIRTKEELISAINEYGENEIVLSINRKGEYIEVAVTPVPVSKDNYMLGIWVKDDMAGIGTMTYYTTAGNFGALGHGMGDGKTGELLSIADGSIYKTRLLGIKKGEKGSPGELEGIIYYGVMNCLGSIVDNDNLGIYGELEADDYLLYQQSDGCYDICYKQNIKKGTAYILSDISGEVRKYEIQIETIDYHSSESNKGIHFCVTDKELLSETGGIVQGMSGSPIIQDGKIIGAVTHVLVNDPTRGYGIFIENMLEH